MPKIYCFNSIDHKGSISLLISSLRVNKLLHGSRNSQPTTKSPQKLTELLHMVSFKNWTQIKSKIGECDQIYSHYPLGPKTLRAPTMQQVLFPQETHCTLSSKIPKVIKHELPQQPLQKSLTLSSSPLYWSLKTCKTFRPLLNTLGTMEVQAPRFS